MSSRRSSRTPSSWRIDRDWPHQVALQDDLCVDRNFTLIARFCQEKGLKHHVRRVQAIWPNGKYNEMRLHCFADPEAARIFQAHFGGEFFNPARDREGGKTTGPWRRDGIWTRLVECGPLSVPPILRN